MTHDPATVPVLGAPEGRRGPMWHVRSLFGAAGGQYVALLRRAPVPVLSATVLLGALTIGGAYAAFSSSSTTNSSVSSATVNRPAAPTPSYSQSAVRLSWPGVVLSDGSAVDSYDVLRHSGGGSTVVCTAVAPTNDCLDTAPLVGTVQYGVVARKADNWTSLEGPLATFVSDQVKPVTSGSSSPVPNGAGWNNSSVMVTLTATDSGGSGVEKITYSVAGDTPVTNPGSSTSFPVSDEGTVNVTYYATDYAGNAENTKTLTLKIDTVAPAPPQLTAISNDTGISASDQVTNASSQALSGTAEPGTTVIVKRGTTTMATVIAGGGGTFATGNLTLASGLNNFTTTATDPAGHVSEVSATFPVTLDTTKPAAPVLTTLKTDTGVSVTDEITMVADQVVNGTAEANSTVTVRQTVPTPTVVLGTVQATSGGAFGFPMVFVVDQATTLTATATDVAGNVSNSSSAYLVRVDQTPPTTTHNTTTPAPNAAGWSRLSTTVNIGQADTGPGTGGTDKLYTKLNGAAYTSVTTATRNVTVGTGVQGNNLVSHYALDKAGNASTTTVTTIRMDSVAPTGTTITSMSSDTGTSGTDRITTEAQQTISGAAEANSTVELVRGGAPVATGTATGSGTYAIPLTLIEGSNSVTARATDIAGNTSASSAAYVMTLDTTMVTPTFIGDQRGHRRVEQRPDHQRRHPDHLRHREAEQLGRGQPRWRDARHGDGDRGTGTFSAVRHPRPGVNSFTATSGDVAGNSVVSPSYPVTLDTSAPAAPSYTAISDDDGNLQLRPAHQPGKPRTSSVQPNRTAP